MAMIKYQTSPSDTKMKTAALAVLLLIVMFWPAGWARAERVQLTRQQVQEIFIDKPWNGPSGFFYFSGSGKYIFRTFNRSRTTPWIPYTVQSDGTLASTHTNYTFYKSTFGYQYYHSFSRKYYPARPNKKLQEFMREGQ